MGTSLPYRQRRLLIHRRVRFGCRLCFARSHERKRRPCPATATLHRVLRAPFERIRHTDGFDDSDLPGMMVTTIALRAVSCGTELHIVQEGIPETIPTEACHLGRQESLLLLAQLVEAEIPG